LKAREEVISKFQRGKVNLFFHFPNINFLTTNNIKTRTHQNFCKPLLKCLVTN